MKERRLIPSAPAPFLDVAVGEEECTETNVHLWMLIFSRFLRRMEVEPAEDLAKHRLHNRLEDDDDGRNSPRPERLATASDIPETSRRCLFQLIGFIYYILYARTRTGMSTAASGQGYQTEKGLASSIPEPRTSLVHPSSPDDLYIGTQVAQAYIHLGEEPVRKCRNLLQKITDSFFTRVYSSRI